MRGEARERQTEIEREVTCGDGDERDSEDGGKERDGRGTQLKEIPNVAYKLSKRKPDDNLFLLHTILYGKKGKVQTLKRNIGLFSGFVWSEQEEEKQRARTKEKIEKCIKDKLIDFCDVLDIPINKSNVKKEELVVSVLEFLLCPKATRDVVLTDPEKETKKRKKSTAKNVTSGESSDVPAKIFINALITGGERRRQTKESGNKQDQPSKSEDTETEDEKDKAEEKKSTSKKNSSKRTKKEKPAAEEEKSLKGSARSGRKSSLKVVKSTSSSSKKQKVDKDDSSKEKGKKQTSKPQAKGSKDQGKASKKGNKREPTRKEMHVVVAKILKEVDFNTATLSDILRKLGSHFGVDLMHRKTEVKDIITDAIDEMSVDDEREENTEDEDPKDVFVPAEILKVELYPPMTKRTKGRPDIKRKLSAGEFPGLKKKKKPNKCSRCFKEGHKKTTCKEPVS
ncbi:hypothetical protein DY000_02006298 [Brassica cretica]|uniref:DEK-C domain-containing protein n=1 Tax=Brassica cretica TaxID=69181 RepID=A0ABQ7CHJ0_BRACR|nr:hypothetical protein DY000_02006298 [Brassica cretica]